MTIVTEGADSLFLSAKATLLDFDRDVASSWAANHVVENKNIKWITGRYVEADNANSNGQFWSYDDLRISQPTIHHSPMNIDHHRNEIVGTWTASEMMFPTDNDAAMNPYIETLGAFWKWYFPEKMDEVQRAYDSGNLWISMECISESITCGGETGCGGKFEYAGPMHDSYCEHIRERSSYRQLDKPNFLGGALIMPGNKPGWKNADVKEISKLTTDDEKNKILAEIALEQPEASSADNERLMWRLQMQFLQESVQGK